MNKKIKDTILLGYSHFQRNFDDVCINKAKNKIRFINKMSVSRGSRSIGFGYFYLDENGIITTCERGYTKQYKGVKVTELDKFPPMMMFGREF